MKIAFFGYDYTLDIVQRLMADGHEIMNIFTFPCDNIFAFNTQTYEFAKHFNIPISDQAIETGHINRLIDDSCEIIICAGYPHKIPDINNRKCYGINLHPTLLPRARGIMPLPYIIMQEPKAAGLTIHKLTNIFDDGDILYQKPIEIDKSTDIETLSARIAVLAPNAISNIVNNIKEYWSNATPQNNIKSSLYNTPSEEMRALNWNDTPEKSALRHRAFGRFGIIAQIKNNAGEVQKFAVFNLSTWQDNHSHNNGDLIRSSNREIIVAINGGYICLKEFQVIE